MDLIKVIGSDNKYHLILTDGQHSREIAWSGASITAQLDAVIASPALEVARGLAAFALQKTLDEGGTVSIPSLNIKAKQEASSEDD